MAACYGSAQGPMLGCGCGQRGGAATAPCRGRERSGALRALPCAASGATRLLEGQNVPAVCDRSRLRSRPFHEVVLAQQHHDLVCVTQPARKGGQLPERDENLVLHLVGQRPKRLLPRWSGAA